MKTTKSMAATGAAGIIAYILLTSSAQAIINPAGSTCVFVKPDSSTVLLQGDCTTNETIWLEDGENLNGQGHAITAEDPPSGHFVGAVIENATAGASIHIKKLFIDGALTNNVCESGVNRLRGVMFRSASGSITHTTIQNINKGASGCQEGNAIEVRNPPFDLTYPFDGTHPDTKHVQIYHNVLESWQKTGIVCNGDVSCDIQHNVIGSSATQANLAPNSVQLGFGAIGNVEHNHIAGNEWLGTTNFVGTAILSFIADHITIRHNNISENSQVGIYVFSDNATVDNNRVHERSGDGREDYFDLGLGDFGTGNSFTNNKVRGYDQPADGDEITGTKVIPAPGDPGAACFLPETSAQSC